MGEIIEIESNVDKELLKKTKGGNYQFQCHVAPDFNSDDEIVGFSLVILAGDLDTLEDGIITATELLRFQGRIQND